MPTKVVHTPGPWKYDLQGDGDFFAILGGGSKLSGLRIIAECPVGDAEAEANARLIAAAPDLLEALKQLCEHYLKATYPSYGGPLWQAAEAAIRKAEGKGIGSVLVKGE